MKKIMPFLVLAVIVSCGASDKEKSNAYKLCDKYSESLFNAINDLEGNYLSIRQEDIDKELFVRDLYIFDEIARDGDDCMRLEARYGLEDLSELSGIYGYVTLIKQHKDELLNIQDGRGRAADHIQLLLYSVDRIRSSEWYKSHSKK